MNRLPLVLIVGIGAGIFGFLGGRLTQAAQEREKRELMRELEEKARSAECAPCPCLNNENGSALGEGDLLPGVPQSSPPMEVERCVEAGREWDPKRRLCL